MCYFFDSDPKCKIPTDDGDLGSAAVVLVPDLVGRLGGLQFLLTLAVDAGVDVDLLGDVQDEAIALVHRLDADWNLRQKSL